MIKYKRLEKEKKFLRAHVDEKSAIRGWGSPTPNGKSHEQSPFFGGNTSLRFIAFLSVCSEFDTLVLVCKKVKKKERL